MGWPESHAHAKLACVTFRTRAGTGRGEEQGTTRNDVWYGSCYLICCVDLSYLFIYLFTAVICWFFETLLWRTWKQWDETQRGECHTGNSTKPETERAKSARWVRWNESRIKNSFKSKNNLIWKYKTVAYVYSSSLIQTINENLKKKVKDAPPAGHLSGIWQGSVSSDEGLIDRFHLTSWNSKIQS